MIDQQKPGWEDDATVDLLAGLQRLCAEVVAQIPEQPGAAETDDPALDFLLGTVVLAQKLLPLLEGADDVTTLVPDGGRIEDLLR